MTGILSARIGSLIPSVLVVNYCACSIASLPNDLASNFDMASDGVIADASLGIPCQYCCSAPKNDGSVMDAALLPNPDGGFALTDDPAIMFPSSLFVDDIAINSTTGLIYVVASAGSIGLLEVVDLNGGCINATLPFAGSYPVSVTVEESTNRIFVVTSDQTMSQVSVVAISGSTNRITDTINLGSGPFFLRMPMIVDDDYRRLYLFDGSRLFVVDIDAMSLMSTWHIAAREYSMGPWPNMSLDPLSHQIYLISPGVPNFPYVLTVVDGATYTTLSQRSFPATVIRVFGTFDTSTRQYLLATVEEPTSAPFTIDRSNVQIGSTTLSVPTDVTLSAVATPFGCGTPESHDWVMYGFATTGLVALQFASDGTLERRVNLSDYVNVFKAVSTGRYVISSVFAVNQNGMPGDTTDSQPTHFLKKATCN